MPPKKALKIQLSWQIKRNIIEKGNISYFLVVLKGPFASMVHTKAVPFFMMLVTLFMKDIKKVGRQILKCTSSTIFTRKLAR